MRRHVQGASRKELAMIDDFNTIPCEPSAVLPAQISGGVRWDGDTSGPRALMLAVLEDAVRCIEEGRRRRLFCARRLAAEAEAWVRCEQRDWPFSFVNICEALGFDPDAVRGRLLTSARDAAHRSRTRVRLRVRSRIRSRTLTTPRRRRANGQEREAADGRAHATYGG
jgi:hypothetical protein